MVIIICSLIKGNFGTVYLAFYKPMKMDVAVKKSKMSMSEDETNKFFQEGVTLGNLSHPNIVIFIGIVIQRRPMIVMEYVPGDVNILLVFFKASIY